MKKKLAAAGYAAGYVLFYFVLQMVVVFLAVLIHEFVLIGRNGLFGRRYAPDVLAEKLTEGVGEATLFAFILAAALAVLLLWLFFAVRKKNFAEEIGWNAQEPFSLTAPFVFGFGIAAVCSFLLGLLGAFFVSVLPGAEEAFQAYEENMGTLTSDSLILNFLSTVIFAPLAEEVVFRGLVYTRLRRAFPKWAAVVTAGIVFGLVHGNLIQILYAAPLGMLLCLIYEKYRSIWGSLAVHVGFNLTGFGVSCLDGGEISEYIYLGVGAVCFAAGLVMLLPHKTDVSDGEWEKTITLPAEIPPVPMYAGYGYAAAPAGAFTAENAAIADPAAESAPVPEIPAEDGAEIMAESMAEDAREKEEAEDADPVPVPDPDNILSSENGGN